VRITNVFISKKLKNHKKDYEEDLVNIYTFFLPPPQNMRVEMGVAICKQACYISKYGIQYLDILRPK
jgi:hypothetical protein